MDRADILKCSKILSTISGNSQREYGTILTRSAIHQKGQAQDSKIKRVSEEEEFPPLIQTKELHIWYHPISKLYTDDCWIFLIRSRSGNEYIMIAYHRDSKTILQAPFFNRKDKHRIRAYNSFMQRLTKEGHQLDVQILDNEVST